jgi:two-component system response regulator CpxR
MRPRKVVLCVCGDEQKLSRRLLMLDIRGYRVIAAANLNEMRRALAEGSEIHLVLIESPLNMPGLSVETLAVARKLWPEIKTLVIYSKAAMPNDWCADAVLCGANNSAAEVLERIKVLVSRKRGPKRAARVIEAETVAA